MVFAQLFEDGAGIFAGLELGSNLLEVLLIFAQIGPADFKELVERQIDHLVVFEFFLECVGADAEVAVGAGEQVGFEPVQVIVERRRRRLRWSRQNSALSAGSSAPAKACGTSC